MVGVPEDSRVNGKDLIFEEITSEYILELKKIMSHRYRKYNLYQEIKINLYLQKLQNTKGKVI